jgi:hypothetical protein
VANRRRWNRAWVSTISELEPQNPFADSDVPRDCDSYFTIVGFKLPLCFYHWQSVRLCGLPSSVLSIFGMAVVLSQQRLPVRLSGARIEQQRPKKNWADSETPCYAFGSTAVLINGHDFGRDAQHLSNTFYYLCTLALRNVEQHWVPKRKCRSHRPV